MVVCMRARLNLDDRFMRLVKKREVETGCTVAAVVEEALREAVATRQTRKAEPRLRLEWVSVRGRVQPGVDLTDRDRLYKRMEERGGSPSGRCAFPKAHGC
jgi:hypothetical protein